VSAQLDHLGMWHTAGLAIALPHVMPLVLPTHTHVLQPHGLLLWSHRVVKYLKDSKVDGATLVTTNGTIVQ
jgi:hypothetical protein